MNFYFSDFQTRRLYVSSLRVDVHCTYGKTNLLPWYVFWSLCDRKARLYHVRDCALIIVEWAEWLYPKRFMQIQDSYWDKVKSSLPFLESKMSVRPTGIYRTINHSLSLFKICWAVNQTQKPTWIMSCCHKKWQWKFWDRINDKLYACYILNTIIYINVHTLNKVSTCYTSQYTTDTFYAVWQYIISYSASNGGTRSSQAFNT